MRDKLKNRIRPLLYGVLVTYSIYAYIQWDMGWILDMPNFSPVGRWLILMSVLSFCIVAWLYKSIRE